jgi:Zn-dependent M28 family amino/carboxypeptidase
VADQLLAVAHETVESLQTGIDRTLRPHSFVIPGTIVTMKRSFTKRQLWPARNVLAVFEGSDPSLKNQFVVVSAHYDHGGVIGDRIYPGADDNASGTVAVLEIARAFVRGGIRPRRSILFIVFDAEERGVLGSGFYITHPVVSLENTVADLNMDMIGRDEESRTWNTTPEQNRQRVNIVGTLYNPELRSVIEAENRYTGLELDYKTDTQDPDRWFARSDHFLFAMKSIPMALFNTGENADYHTENDTWDKINYPKMTKIIQLVFRTSVAVANRNDRIKFTP